MILPATSSKRPVIFSNLSNEIWVKDQLANKALEDVLVRSNPGVFSRKVTIKTLGPNAYVEEFDMVDFGAEGEDLSSSDFASVDQSSSGRSSSSR